MKEMLIKLPYGHSSISFYLTRGSLISTLKPRFKEKLKNFEEVFLDALEKPIGTESLPNIISSKKVGKVSILLDDITRPGPKKQAVEILTTYLMRHGVKRESITIIFALGLHRKHTQNEWISMLGTDIVNKFKIIDHDPDDKWGLEYLGETRRGTPVEVNKIVADSDLIIGISYLGIHDFAGYTGGAKIILPGVSSRRAIKRNHILSLDERSQPGVADGNPAREDMEDAATLVEYDFSINIPLNYKEQPIGVFAGHFIHAHRAGIGLVDELYKVKTPKKADVVFASVGGFPHDIDLYQSERALRYLSRIVHEGGTIVLFSECKDGVGNTDMETILFKMKKDLKKIKDELLRDYTIGKWVGWDFLVNSSKFDVIIVSPNLNAELFSGIGVKIVKNPNQAINYVLEKHGNDFEFFIVPYANITLPVI